MNKLLMPALMCLTMLVGTDSGFVWAQSYNTGNNSNSNSNSGSTQRKSAVSSSSSRSSRNSLNSKNTTGNTTGNNNNNNNNNGSSNSRRRKSSSTTSSAAKKKADDAKKKADAQKKTTTTGKTSAKTGGTGKSGGTGKPGEGGTGNLAPFNIKPNEATNMLSVELASVQPTMNILVRKDEVFATRIMFRSGGMEEFDTMDISLKYDPRILEPQGLDDKSFASRLAEPALARVDRKKGIIAWHAKFAQPTVVNQSEVFRVAWKPISLSDDTKLTFLNSPDYPSRVMKGRRNLLLPLDPEGAELRDDAMTDKLGLLGADVTVVTDLVTDETADGTSGTAVVTTVGSNVIKLARDIEEGVAVGNMQMTLKSSTPTPSVGRDFFVTVGYTNPNVLDWDRVRFTLNFDPKVLQVVDWDQDNWITQGVNVFDADWHEELPFDVHLKNQVLNNMGRVFYEMAFTHRPAPVERGNIARIRFRPIKESPLTAISFEQLDGDDILQSPSAISFLGCNLVGTPGRRALSYGKVQFPVGQTAVQPQSIARPAN